MRDLERTGQVVRVREELARTGDMDAPALLDNELHGAIERILDEGEWRREPGGVKPRAELGLTMNRVRQDHEKRYNG